MVMTAVTMAQVICILREPVDKRAVDLQLGYGEQLQAASEL